MASTIEQAAGSLAILRPIRGHLKVLWGKRIDESVKVTNRRKSSVRAKVESVFGVIKRVLGFQQVCYRGLAKNLHRLGRMSCGKSAPVFQTFPRQSP
jgi:Transposase DDE domain